MTARDVFRRIAGRGVTASAPAGAGDGMEKLRGRVDRIGERTQRTAKDAELHVREMNRVAPQLAALEGKVEDLRQLLADAPRVDEPGDSATARSLVEEIRREHAQVRVRLSAVTTYEERLRRIEEKLDLPHD